MTVVSSPAGEWELLGESSFCWRSHLYDLEWANIDFDSLKVACAPFGGPIATTRDESKIVRITGPNLKPSINIYQSTGCNTASILWERNSIAALGWTEHDELLVIERTGEVWMYDQLGNRLATQFSFGESCMQEGIQQCQTYHSGAVVLTSAMSLWLVADLQDPKPQRLASPRLAQTPACMTIMDPKHTLSGTVEVIIGTSDKLVICDSESRREEARSSAPIRQVAVSAGALFVAVLTEDMKVVFWTSDFTRIISTCDVEDEELPLQMAWSGSQAVALAWQDRLLVVSVRGETAMLELEEPVLLVPEVDGVRLVGTQKHELLRLVPQCLVDVFQIGSDAAGATLYDARQMFDQQDVKADELLREIVAERKLPEAVETCSEAAAAEFDLGRQKALLKAACYGRAFCPPETVDRKLLLHTAQKLRVLTALREHDCAMPLTMEQFSTQGPRTVIQRLIKNRRHLLALRIADLLQEPTEEIVMHWACAKISAASGTADDQLLEILDAKLKLHSRLQFTTIADHAQATGRKYLAAQLLSYEKDPAKQVPLLLKLDDMDRALQRAEASGDPDLLFLVLFHLFREPQSMQQAIKALRGRPSVQKLFLAYCASADEELLQKICTQLGQYEALAMVNVKKSLSLTNSVESWRGSGTRRVNTVKMDSAVTLLEQAAQLYAQTKEHVFEARAASELAKLRTFQAELEQETGNACFVGLSLVGTAQQCLSMGNERAAKRVQHDFKIPERRFWWLKAKALAQVKDWDNLLVLAADKRNGGGPSVVLSMMKANAAPTPVLARCIARLPDAGQQAQEYTVIGMLQQAAEIAEKRKDVNMLGSLQGIVGLTSPLGLSISQIKDRLQSSGR